MSPTVCPPSAVALLNRPVPDWVVRCSAWRCRGCRTVLRVRGQRRLAVGAEVGVLGVEHARTGWPPCRARRPPGSCSVPEQPVRRGDRVAVAVVAEQVGQLHPGAVDRAVLRVGHGDRVRHGVAEAEQGAVDRRGQGDRGAVLPTVITTLAVPVRPAGSVTVRRDRALAVAGVGVARVGRRGGGAVAEVPRVGQRAALRVRGAGGGEVDGQRRECRTCGRRWPGRPAPGCRPGCTRCGTARSWRRRRTSRCRSPARTARRPGRRRCR